MGSHQSKTNAAAHLGIDRPALEPMSPNALAKKESIGSVLKKRAAYGKVTTESISKYLEELGKSGVIVRACVAANLCNTSIENLRKKDPEFAELEKRVKADWVTRNIDEPFRQIAHGEWKKMVLNPKTGELLQGESIISPQIALAWARKFDPEMREKQQLDVNHAGGVTVVTAPALSDNDLEALSRAREMKMREAEVQHAESRDAGSVVPHTNQSPLGDDGLPLREMPGNLESQPG